MLDIMNKSYTSKNYEIGLSSEQARERLAKVGTNTLAKEKKQGQ